MPPLTASVSLPKSLLVKPCLYTLIFWTLTWESPAIQFRLQKGSESPEANVKTRIPEPLQRGWAFKFDRVQGLYGVGGHLQPFRSLTARGRLRLA